MAFKHATGFGLASTTSGVEVDTWNGTGASRNSTGGRSGQGSLKILNPATGVRTGIALRFASAAPGLQYCRFYLKIATRPNVRTVIAKFVDNVSMSVSGNPAGAIELDTDGTLILCNYNTGSRVQIGSPSAALTNGQTYRIELFEDGSGAGGTNTLTARIDGTNFSTDSTLSISGISHTLQLGANLQAESCTTGEWELSDCVVYDTTGSTQNSWPGDGALAYLWPDAAGDNAEGAAGGSSPAATGWQSVDENPPDDGVTFWELQRDSSAGSGNPDRLDVSVSNFPTTPRSVAWVAVGMRHKPLTNATCSIVPRVKSQASGTVAEGTTTSITGTAWTTHDDTATSRQYKLCRTTDPQSGSAWGVNPSGWQIGVRAPDGNPNVDVTALWALVEYVPGAYGWQPETPAADRSKVTPIAF